MKILLYNLLSAFLLTVVIESLPLLFCKPRKAWLIAGLLCNCATNPVLNIARILFYSLWQNHIALLCLTVALEIAVVFVEAWLYRLLTDGSRPHCFFLSLICNCLSVLAGILLLP